MNLKEKRTGKSIWEVFEGRRKCNYVILLVKIKLRKSFISSITTISFQKSTEPSTTNKHQCSSLANSSEFVKGLYLKILDADDF